MARMTFSEQIKDLIVRGVIEGQAVLTLHHLLKAYQQGLISVEEMQYEIHSFNPEIDLEVPQDEHPPRF